MSMLVHSQEQYGEVIRKVWGQLFGIFMRKAREESYLPLAAIANLARMRVPEWLAMEAGQVPDPEKLEEIAAVLGIGLEKMEIAVQLCRGAWED